MNLSKNILKRQILVNFLIFSIPKVKPIHCQNQYISILKLKLSTTENIE